MVTLRFCSLRGHDDHPAARRARSARRRRSPARAPRARPRAPARAPRGGRPAASAPPTARLRSSVSSTPPPASTPLDRVGDGRGRDRRVGRGVGVAAPRSRARRAPASSSGRAASWTSTGSPSPAAASASAHRLRAHRAALDARVTPSGGARAGGQRDARSARSRLEPRRARRCSTAAAGGPRSSTSAFGPAGPEALAAAGGDDQGDGHLQVGLSRTRQASSPVLPRAREPRYLAPATAICWLAESASSSSR